MRRTEDWVNQAKADLSSAKNALKYEDYAWSCFLAQQIGEKSFKALGEEFNLSLWGHDLVDLINEIKIIVSIPKSIEDDCRTLNLYYISTRYPDAFTSGFPAEKFSKTQAEEAIKIASEVLKFAEDRVKENRRTLEKTS